ncbi:DUF5363 domain-containing protein [Necropsobacter massiliensis]|uniref:DUF5363 domain-containing protein n=1 Tax=Necropsobacter massiliensis TaxID=1400001 RepID=UPI000A85BBE5|nr:DUF5363 domain-containing protein [Necropsobacter massiliensis]
MSETKKSWLRRALDKYNAFCEEVGVDQGACRSCIPVVRFDESGEKKTGEKTDEHKDKL